MIHDFFKCDHSGRMTGDKRRELILHTAFDLFSQRGFSGTTTKDIARASGVSEAMVFKHFSSKDELYAAIIETKTRKDGLRKFPWEDNQPMLAAMAADDDYGVFYHWAMHALNKQQTEVNFMRMLFYSALEEHKLAERFFGEFITEIYDFLGKYIKRRQKAGVFRNIDPRIVVRSFLGMMIHHSLNNILWDKKRKILDITNEEAAKNFAEILLKGISK